MNSSEVIVERVIRYWTQQPHIQLQAGASDAQVSEFQAKYSIELPSQMRDIYRRVNGFYQQTVCSDDNGFNFYPLRLVKRVNELEENEDVDAEESAYFVFCDYLAECWWYAIRIDHGTTNEVVRVEIPRSPGHVVADTFFEFLDLYTCDDSKLYV
jgi:hypothetical protein